VLSTITVIHRISYTYTMAKKLALDRPAIQTEPVPIRSAASPGPVSSTASVSRAEQHDLISAPTGPRA
jgi:hypothetical protein